MRSTHNPCHHRIISKARVTSHTRLRLQWGPGPSRPPVKVWAGRPHASSWPPKRPESRHRSREALKNPTGTARAPSPFSKYVATRKVPTCSFAGCLFSVSCARLHKTSRPTYDFRVRQYWLCRNAAKRTSLVSSKTRTFVQFMRSV